MARLLSDPDPVLVREQLEALQGTLKALGVEGFCRFMFWILPKHSKIIPLQFNPMQADLAKKIHPRRNRLLKMRQGGATTWFLLVRVMLPVITTGGRNGLLVNFNSKYAYETFFILRRAYRLIGAVDPYNNERNSLCYSLRANLLHTIYSNRRELVFDQLDGKISVESAEVEEAGQSVTLHHVVASEIARWPHDPDATASNIKGALVPDGTWDEESTANGAAGPFYENYIAALDDVAKADCRVHFYAHYWEPSYRLALTPAEAAELEADLESDELALIAKMHRELQDVAWPKVA